MRHVLLVLLMCTLLPAGVRAESAPEPAPLSLKFDYVAADDFLRAVDRAPLDAAQWQRVAAERGAVAMVRNTLKYVPASPAEGYFASLRALAKDGSLAGDPYWLKAAVASAATIRTLLAAVKRDEQAMSSRIASRLGAHWKSDQSVSVTVYLVIGGASDGFVLDGEDAPEFFIAIDKAAGDLAGLEQNITHESVHVLQRQLALAHCPKQVSIEKRDPVARFHATVYEEGVANYLADPAQITGDGEYIGMWRDRYRRNATPERVRENAWLYSTLLDGLKRGVLSWETAYQFGFDGNNDARLYFHGRDIAQQWHASGTSMLSGKFSCRPESFFEPHVKSKQVKLKSE